jgi:hypothetical protein
MSKPLDASTTPSLPFERNKREFCLTLHSLVLRIFINSMILLKTKEGKEVVEDNEGKEKNRKEKNVFLSLELMTKTIPWK